jgi:hypothetical protein
VVHAHRAQPPLHEARDRRGPASPVFGAGGCGAAYNPILEDLNLFDSHERQGVVRTIRLDDARVLKLLSSLDANATSYASRRHDPRYSYRVKRSSAWARYPWSNSTPRS